MTPAGPSSTPPPPLAPGDRLGRYEIAALVGAGGMGEVYRAHDPQLRRDVALKVLRGHRAEQKDIDRFIQEARRAGSLSHENIVAVYDVGAEGDLPFVVTELLEGETLRAQLDRRSVPFHKAVEYGIRIAQALDAAHEKTIWHCDVKPANVFITKAGQVKLLDFGIAKLGQRSIAAGSEDATAEVSKDTKIFGTAGYMSPEQVLGRPVDHRTDVFALGAVLYEMFTGSRAFKRATDIETMTAVLRADPPDPLTLNADLPSPAVAVVQRCLEKNPEERFQSARDLVFSLQQLHGATTSRLPNATARPRLVRRALWPIAAVAVASIVLWATSGEPPSPVAFEPVTFASGVAISGARFTQAGGAVIFSQARQGTATEVFQVDLATVGPPTSQPQPLDYGRGSDVLAAGPNGDVALLTDRQFVIGERFAGTLARVVVGAGRPREIDADIEDADYGPGGELAVVRSRGSPEPSTLEYPRGTTVLTRQSSLRFPRVSPNGEWIAFLEDTSGRGAGGRVWRVGANGEAAAPVTVAYGSVRGLDWSPDGHEIWFAAGGESGGRALRAVDFDGRDRLLRAIPGSLTLWDVAEDGRLLITVDEERRSTRGLPPGETEEREFAWYDNTGVADLSLDGRTILFRDRFGLFTWRTDGSEPPVQLDTRADVFADALSPDGEFILATRAEDLSADPARPATLLRLPRGIGDAAVLGASDFTEYQGARVFPGSERILFNGRKPNEGRRAYVQSIAGGPPQPLTPEGEAPALSIDSTGSLVATVGSDEGISLWPVGGGSPRQVPGSLPDDRPVAFSEDGRSLFVFRREVPAPVVRLDIATGRRDLLMTIPQDVTGVYSISEFWITPAGHAYFYSYKSRRSQLYVVRGVQ